MRFLVLLLAVAVSFSGPGSQDPVKLRPDGRVGLIIDQQGLSTMRPVGRERWTAVSRGRVLMPGDQLRSSPRGANAVEVQLPDGAGLLLGPGALVDFETENNLHLLRGDLEIRPVEGKALTVRGPGGYEQELRAATILRAGDETMVLTAEPRWLSGYRSSTTDEWLGSLVAQVDGREVPLSVGYHKVEVDIKDQIARTTVEQSFVNSTRSRLEGVFYFPLPAGASISGFGMWIGGELVEADIVEKQRAREIFEDILRRKKDPGLLEWSGGNLFKARVFPIEAQSEKRIRIRYTQALPRNGNLLQYRYALRSELLRSRPLRELSIRVNVDSAMPIEMVSSPSHELRIRKTAHNAVIEFDAQEYTPQRDFELNLQIDAGQPLTIIPHRRGDDGYFMLQLTPPGSDQGSLHRDLITEGDPVNLLILADTSASMDSAARTTQAEFVAALLAMLGEADRFRLMTVDLAVRPFRADAVPVNEANAIKALRFLAARDSLGWTDLDLAFSRALEVAEPDCSIIYLGDGIVTTGDADPIALSKRLRSMADQSEVTCHAVATSSTYEQPVLEAMAVIGGGSVREIGDDPIEAAARLLAEAAQPMIKDLELIFDGLQVARVYPEQLPNLSAGSQQIILGRYLPGVDTQTGRVLVRGTLLGKQVEFSSEVQLPAGDAGNSFIPRLWARKHVDALLNEGRSPRVMADIVAFSEEFGIMTPYTSLLVLESDADRERYGVDRRVKMRDGERFFAAARDKASLEILRQQMNLAKTWRMNLWRRMAGEIEGLGADLYNQPVAYAYGAEFGAVGGKISRLLDNESSRYGGYWGDDAKDWSDGPTDGFEDLTRRELSDRQRPRSSEFDPAESFEEVMAESELQMSAPSVRGKSFYAKEDMVAAKRVMNQSFGEGRMFAGSLGLADRDGRFRGAAGNRRNAYYPTYGFARFGFPAWPGVPGDMPKIETPSWPSEVFDLLERMDRRAVLGDAAIAVSMTVESLHHLRGQRIRFSLMSGLFAQRAWYIEQRSRGSQRMASWLFDGTRGVAARDFQVGRRRQAATNDQNQWPMPLSDYSAKALSRSYARYQATMTRDDQSRPLLTFTAPAPNMHRVELVIDEERGVVLEARSYQGDSLVQTTSFDEFEEIGGQWWPTRIDIRNAAGRMTQRQELGFEALTAEAFAARITAALPSEAQTLFLDRTDPELATAKQLVHEGKGDFADHLRLVLMHAETQQWEKAWVEYLAAESKMAGKPAAPWLRTILMSLSRSGEDLKGLLTELSAAVQKAPKQSQTFLSEYLLNMAAGSLQAEEQLQMLNALRAQYFAPDPDLDWRQQVWSRRQAQNLQNRGRSLEALEVYQALAESHPDEMQDLLTYLQLASGQGMADRAISMGRARLSENRAWDDYELYQLYDRLSNLLWELRRLQDLGSLLAEWVDSKPTQEVAYQRYLSVLMFLGRDLDADRWIQARFDEELNSADDRAQIARVGAAIQMSLGQGWQFYSYRLEEKWIEPLKSLAIRLAKTDSNAINHAGRILSNHLFRKNDAHAEVRAELASHLMAETAIANFSLRRLSLYIGWIDWQRDQVDDVLWRHVCDQLLIRWDEGETEAERPQIAEMLVRVLDQYGAQEEAIEFLRRRLARCADHVRPQVARSLMNRLAAGPWSEAIESELFALVPKLILAGQPERARRGTIAMAVRQLADSLLQMRRMALLGAREEYESLPRAELREKAREALRQARSDLVASFETAALSADEGHRVHYEMERLCFAVRLQDDLRQRDGEARELMASLGQDDLNELAAILRQRSSLVMAYASTRRKAPLDLADELLNLYRGHVEDGSTLLDWRFEVFRLLVVLDRPEELEKELRSWIVPAQVASDWQIALGYLLAETGRMQEAVELFEQVVAKDELGPIEQDALATWYASLNDDSRSEQALLARYQAMPEHVLSQRLSEVSNRLSRRGSGVPESFDPDSLRILQVLLAKATQPQNYINQVRDLYSKIKDFRLLASIADGILGHSAQQVYPFLSQSWQLIQAVHEEATCDQLNQRISELKSGRKGVDLRALILLEFMVERRASEVLNAPGPHGDKALSAMRDAFKGEWSSGERQMMAEFLAALGRIPLEPVAAEQRRQLRALYNGSTGIERLKIAHQLGVTLWNYGQQDEAEDILWIALVEYHDAAAKAFGQETNSELGTLVSWWHARRRLAKAEDFLAGQLMLPGSDEQRAMFLTRLFETYLLAMQHGNALKAGSGKTLYPAARERMVEAMFRSAPNHLQNMLQQFLRLHRLAREHAGVVQSGADLERFARLRLPELLTRSNSNRQYMVQQVGNELHHLSGAAVGLRFFIEQIEGEPKWLGRVGRSGWQSYGHYLGQWRREAGNVAGLLPRLLAIVLRELERDLVDQNAANRSMYQVGSSYFWVEQRPRFIATADRVLAEKSESAAHQLYIAEYFWHGLRMYPRAIDIMFTADRRGRLSDDGRFRLVSMLHQRNRWTESIPLLQGLIEIQPERLDYRLSMVRALHEDRRDAEGLAFLDSTVQRFRDQQRLKTNALATIAQMGLTCGYWQRSIELYEELIPLHQASAQNRGIGDGSLSNYYGQVARAYAGLGRSAKAVEAASAAVVAWGRNQQNRQSAISALESVVRQIADLPAYEEQWDKQVEASGMDSALIRRTLGRIYFEQRSYDRAIINLLSACELQPEDSTIYGDLVSAYDGARDPKGAIGALRMAITATPLNLDHYQALAERLDRAGEDVAAERALTSLVEVLPNEADSHRRLAVSREAAKRFAEAIVQRRQVVRIRGLEPEGWFALARVQGLAGKRGEALKTLQHVLKTTWDTRFGDVRRQAVNKINELDRSRPPR